MTAEGIAAAARRLCCVLALRLGVLLLVATPAVVLAQSKLQPWTGAAAAPAIELKTLDGQPLALSDLRGKAVVVNFWATWCEPCIEEMPSMQRLRGILGAERFEIVAVNFMEGAPRIRRFLEKVPLSFPIVRDTDGGVARTWKVRIFPSSFVVDPDGVVRYVLVGSIDWDAPEVEKTLRALLRSSRAGASPQ